MDPQTGDVLALANWPTFNPQNLEDSTHETPPQPLPDRPLRARLDDQAVHRRPGARVAHHAAERGLADPRRRTARRPTAATVTDVHGYGQLAMWDVLVKSSNIGMSMLGERMGNAKLHEALTRVRLRPTDRHRTARRRPRAASTR